MSEVFSGVCAAIDQNNPDEVAIERLFLKSNAATAVPAIQAAGVAMLAAAERGLGVFEYQPANVKQAVVGVGSATKQQVSYMVDKLVSFPSGSPPEVADANDALAVAICHAHSGRHLEAVR